ncbi:MAG: hypothetical protein ACOXZK_11230 [Bacteroidales bacterium]|jgi:hypothetical protein|nr:hypothetical protein [Bacteroidales bacterium]
MKRIIFLILIITQFCASKGQNTVFVRYDSIPIYEIAHSDFENILDSFIVKEKKLECIDDNTVFRIGVLDMMYGTSIQLSQTSRENSFNVNDNFDSFGLLHYKDYLFQIVGRVPISNKILKMTDEKQIIAVYDLDPDYINSSKIHWYIDEEWCTTWIYSLEDDKFVLTYNSENYNQ